MLFDLVTFPEFRHLNREHLHVVFDVNSTRLLLVDEVLLSVLLNARGFDGEGLEKLRSVPNKAKEVEAAIKVMHELVHVHRLLMPQSAGWSNASTGGYRARTTKVDYILLNVSTACQLRCKYCFADGGHYGRPNDEQIMSWEVAQAAIDMLDFRDVERHHLAVGFFGGEPLVNWDVVEKSINYVRDITHEYTKTKVVYNMTTNGIGLSVERAQFLKDNDCSVMFSIDGKETTHNVLRPAKAGTINSWQSTVQGYNNWLSVGGRALTARSTVTAKDVDIVSMVDILRGLGFAAVNTQLVQSDDPELRLSVEQLQQYTATQVSFLRDDITKSTDLQRVFTALRAARPRLSFCGVGRSGFAVQPNGDVFLCHRFASDDRFKIGHVFHGVDQDAVAKHQGWRVDNSLVCARCWARNLCGGGCYAENYFATQDPLSPRPERCYITKAMLYHSIEFLAQHSEEVPPIQLTTMSDC